MQNQSDLLPRTALIQNILLQNPAIKTVLERASGLDLPNWYLGAGCIAQTVWNYYSKRPLLDHISDMDLVYFDDQDPGFEAEDENVNKVREAFSDIPVQIDLKNQARVHLWYEKHFGYAIKPYGSVEEAINTWPTTATAVGVKYDEAGRFVVYAPYGLEDLLGRVVRPNKIQITEEIYLKKATRWKACWPDLTVIPW
ncbi:MAG: nucleotidyltransferase family protein [Proteobacteria bacterium]|nr:nucleotidyltransferase family protein [Pseudomonadota bacterium]MBU4471957.1 nucleotidyltransferase family protein [Pseudomonadota bacterium]MCG2753424.1 nucleotidyltransferase family protein [Desulfobacteraceae bacterium]